MQLKISFLDGVFRKSNLLRSFAGSGCLIVNIFTPGNYPLRVFKPHQHRDIGCLKVEIAKTDLRSVCTGVLLDLNTACADSKFSGDSAFAYTALLGMNCNHLLRNDTGFSLFVATELNVFQPLLETGGLVCGGWGCRWVQNTPVLIEGVVYVDSAFSNALKILLSIIRSSAHPLNGLLNKIAGERIGNQHSVL